MGRRRAGVYGAGRAGDRVRTRLGVSGAIARRIISDVALLRCDSFNHYDTLTNKWDFTAQGVIVSGVARTGTRCCQIIGGSSGPSWNLGPQQIGTNYTKLIQGMALNFDGLSANSDVMYFSWVAPGIQSPNIGVVVNTDGSISVFRGAGDAGKVTLGTSVSKPFVFTADTTQ